MTDSGSTPNGPGPTAGATAAAQRHTVFQTSLMSALLDGVYDGEMTISELLEHGDFGVGTFNALDGEMVVLDSVCYQLRGSGEATVAGTDQQTPFAVLTRFAPTISKVLPPNLSRAEVASLVGELIPSENYLYAMRIAGDFRWVRTRTAARQHKPYPPLREATRNEPVIQFDDVSGIVAGFRTPMYEQGIGVPGGHVHFIDDDRKRGGHVLDYAITRGTLELCLGTDLHVALPLTSSFRRAQLNPDDLAEQIAQTENHR
jgi:acetolactate decarboxylase